MYPYHQIAHMWYTLYLWKYVIKKIIIFLGHSWPIPQPHPIRSLANRQWAILHVARQDVRLSNRDITHQDHLWKARWANLKYVCLFIGISISMLQIHGVFENMFCWPILIAKIPLTLMIGIGISISIGVVVLLSLFVLLLLRWWSYCVFSHVVVLRRKMTSWRCRSFKMI